MATLNRQRKQLKQMWYGLDKHYMLTIMTIISYIIMIGVMYWATPINRLLNILILCSLSNFISAVFFIKGMRYQINVEDKIEKKIKKRMDAVRKDRLVRSKNFPKDKTISLSTPIIKKKRIDTKKDTNIV